MAMMQGQEMNEYLRFAYSLADAAGKTILPYFRSPLTVESKQSHAFDPVTIADKSAEQAMRKLIQQTYPDHGILGEEAVQQIGTSPMTWVLDPIDGTEAFIAGLPLWGTLIALSHNEQVLFGIMNQPFTRERYIGTANGTWLNKKRVQTRRCTSLYDATIMCSSPKTWTSAIQKIALQQILSQARLVHYSGDCYAYCMLASGHVDLVIETNLAPYDIQAIIPIMNGAGGIISRWDGSDADNGGDIIACGDSTLYEKILPLLTHV
jgi:histidinol phosphatase-like enzyme (inositol monophosphatase family)